jgi:hypothetical protein
MNWSDQTHVMRTLQLVCGIDQNISQMQRERFVRIVNCLSNDVEVSQEDRDAVEADLKQLGYKSCNGER